MRDDLAGVGFGGPDMVRPAADDDVPDGGPGREVVGLPQIAHRQAGRVGDSAGIGFAGSGQHLQQRCLAVAVSADDADGVAVVDTQADPIEQRSGAVTDGRAFNVDQVRHQPR